jgi:hypothetical protein
MQEDAPEEVRNFFEQHGRYQEVPMDLDGRVIRMIHTNPQRWEYQDDIDRTPNDTIQVRDLLKEIENDYNCVIELIREPRGNDITNRKIAMKSAGDVLGELYVFATTDVGMVNMIQNDLVIPVHDPRIVDVLQPDVNPWLAGSSLTTLRGVQYGVHFLARNNADIIRACLLFNRDYIERFNLGNPYDMVRNRTWTFDNFESMLRQVAAQDADMIPVARIAQENIWAFGFVYANGGIFAKDTPTGFEFVAHENEATLEALTFAQSLIQNQLMTEGPQFFYDGRAVFCFTIYNELRRLTNGDIPNDLGVVGLLPFPIGNEGMSANVEYGAVTHHVESFFVPENIRNPEEVAAIIVAMANRLTREEVLGHELNFNLQDDPSGEMLALMLNNMQINPVGFVGGPGTMGAITSLSATPRQAMDAAAPSVQAGYDRDTTPR